MDTVVCDTFLRTSQGLLHVSNCTQSGAVLAQQLENHAVLAQYRPQFVWSRWTGITQ